MTQNNISEPTELFTERDLRQLQPRRGSVVQRWQDYIICLLPLLSGFLAILEYIAVPNLAGNESTSAYLCLLLFLLLLLSLTLIIAINHPGLFAVLRYKSPFYTFIFLLLIVWDYLTLKTGTLLLPYFPWVDQILVACIDDRAYLTECALNSLILLFSGYLAGTLSGLLTGVACGYSKRVNYWIAPFMRLLGAIPSTTWIPVVMVLAASLFKGSVFIIALGVWFSVTLATITGITHIEKAYFQAAKTLGATEPQLIFRVAIPFALPAIFQGLTQGMSSACTALMVAEMIGVESGLGWYISWQKSWAQYGKMYAAIILICIIFILVNYALSRLRRYVLRWQDGVIRN
ncbi:ABC transporter permease [Intestinirhabdus alba]|jgi:NitT/TauT family transport system permease protein|uniref:ABC transporter permease subunit n=1 Tax=Intestinirhabdus alba TaxID=2899544 RepID=A0A6L6IPB0_9ENTR|nr:ABC transporter permease subunit [Intestinirhabdus alba]MTH47737.1 ABC transporter permease subunit [Intestinirhabdus alba]